MDYCQVEVTDVACHTFEPHYLDIIDAEDEEVRLCDVDQA
jgi:predicted RNA-binding protein associated with RNAse of E/G family